MAERIYFREFLSVTFFFIWLLVFLGFLIILFAVFLFSPQYFLIFLFLLSIVFLFILSCIFMKVSIVDGNVSVPAMFNIFFYSPLAKFVPESYSYKNYKYRPHYYFNFTKSNVKKAKVLTFDEEQALRGVLKSVISRFKPFSFSHLFNRAAYSSDVERIQLSRANFSTDVCIEFKKPLKYIDTGLLKTAELGGKFPDIDKIYVSVAEPEKLRDKLLH